MIKSKIQTEILVPVTNLKQNHKNNTVSLKCCHKNDIEKTREKLSKILGSNYTVKTENLLNPKIKIVGIPNNMCIEEIENDINMRNFQDYTVKCKIIHIYKTKKNTVSAIIDIPSDLYLHVRNNNYLVFIGAQKCHAYDYFDLLPCENCGRIGHSYKKCTNETVCILCFEKHDYRSCKTKKNIWKCTNCVHNNINYNTKYNTNHLVNDTINCEYLKKKINNVIINTNYNIVPVIPKYLGLFNINKNNNKFINKKYKTAAVANHNTSRNTTVNKGNDRSSKISPSTT